jgi:hypothetical protein
MDAIAQVTAETLAMIKKAATEGILVGTGVQGVDLSGLVALVPVNVPARNNTSAFPRVIAGEGSQTAVWRSLLNINAEQSDAAVGFDFAGSLTKFSEQDCFAPYKPLAKAGRVTLDAVAVARNYADALAVAELQTLNQLFIDQDLHIVNSQNWPLGSPGTPTATTSATGGTIKKSSKFEVAVAARSGANYFIGGASKASTAQKIETGGAVETNSLTAHVAAVKGAVAYDWYVGVEGSTKLFYYTTTTIASVTVTAVPTKAEALPKLPLLSGKAPFAEAKLTVENSSSPNWYNGVIASTLGDYGDTGPVKPGTGTPSGATFIDFGGAKIAASGASIGVLDQINDELWASVQLSPTSYMVNSLQGDEISDLILGSSASLTFLPPTDADARTNLAGGGYIGRYINKAAGGVPVMIEVHPRVAPGTIIARTDRVPFPGSNIGSVYEVRCQYDTMRFDYAANYNPGVEGGGPRYDFEIRSMETLVNRAPVAQAVVSNVG